MQILGLLGMYFDAVAVEVEKYLLFFRLALAILCSFHEINTESVKLQTNLANFLEILWLAPRPSFSASLIATL